MPQVSSSNDRIELNRKLPGICASGCGSRKKGWTELFSASRLPKRGQFHLALRLHGHKDLMTTNMIQFKPMFQTRVTIFLAIILSAFRSFTAHGAEANKSTFVIIHGAFGGGWDWKRVGQTLTERGHTVYRPTLTGLGERAHLATPEIGLKTHIQDVVNVLRYESLTNVVLCAHSYGGMVATGVMEEVPERLQQLIFLDAVMPDDGETFFTFHEAMGTPFEDKPENGFSTLGGSFTFNKPPPSEVPQPFKTFTDAVSFKNPAAKALPATLVFFLENDQKPEAIVPIDDNSRFRHNIFKRATSRGWKIQKFKGDHVVEKSHPRELALFLDSLVQTNPQKAPQ